MIIPRITRCLLILMLCIPGYNADAKVKTLTLRKAIAAKLVSIRASALGGISCKALKLEVSNNTEDNFHLQIEPGLMFKPDDTTTQPLVTQGDEVLVLNACEQKSIEVNAFCGNSGASCPRKNGGYTFSRQLDTNLVSILRYAKNSGMPLWLSQHTVWMYTNGHSLNSVYSPKYPKQSETLVRYIAARNNMKVPTFFMSHRIDSSGIGAVVRHGHEKVYANMSWSASKVYRNVYVSVLRPDGKLYKRINGDIISDKYGSTVVVEFYAHRDPPGQYIIRVHDDAGNTLDEKTIELGVAPGSY